MISPEEVLHTWATSIVQHLSDAVAWLDGPDGDGRARAHAERIHRGLKPSEG